MVEEHNVELVAEARGEGPNGGVAPHPGAPEILVVGQVEGDVVAPADQPIGEFDHAPDAAEALEMGLHETEAHDGLAGYRPADAASERPLTLSPSQVGAREGRIMAKGDSMKESLLKRSPAVIFGTLAGLGRGASPPRHRYVGENCQAREEGKPEGRRPEPQVRDRQGRGPRPSC